MKLRPQFQLRFRDAAQFDDVKGVAASLGLSVTEFVLRAVEAQLSDLAAAQASASGDTLSATGVPR